MISHAQIEERFKYILTILPDKVVESLKKCWRGNDLPMIITDQKMMDSDPLAKGTKQASSTWGIHFYRLNKIKNEKIDEIILHESAHDYFFVTGAHDYLMYVYGADNGYRRQVEAEVRHQVREWMHNPKKIYKDIQQV